MQNTVELPLVKQVILFNQKKMICNPIHFAHDVINLGHLLD